MELVPFDPAAGGDVLNGAVEVERVVSAEEDPTAPPMTADDARGLLTYGWGLRRRRHAALLVDGRVEGYCAAVLRDSDNTHVVECRVAVHPQTRRRGYGRVLLDHVHAVGRDDGRRTLLGEAAHVGPGAEFARAVGALEALVETRSICTLADVPDEVLDDAASRAPAYALVRWRGRCPDELVEAYARARLAINDAPVQELDWEDEAWTPTLVRDHEEAAARRQRDLFVVCAQAPDGTLAALTEVLVNDHGPRRAEQGNTSVVPEHRGHGLGLRVKAEMVRWLRAERPDVEEVETRNAGDNAWMLAINRRLGYRALDQWSEWQLPVAPL